MNDRSIWKQFTGRRGFSLVELLVVAAIIALLVAVILPSLQGAREQALAVKCAANLRAVAQAAGGYQVRYNEWLPGAPGTTGSALLGLYAGMPGDAELMPVAPVQTWDYAGPLLHEQFGIALPANRGDRFTAVVAGPFECPSNLILSVPFYTRRGPTGSFRVQKAVSYNTVRNFMMWPKRTVNGQSWGDEPPFYDDGNPAGWDGNISASSKTVIPRGYVPRVDRVGAPAEKVFLADASRYTDSQGVSHNIHWRGATGGGAAGGAFSTGSPCLTTDILRSYWFEDPQRSYAYRHPKGKSKRGLIAAYYDSHAEWVSEARSRRPDAWYPKGTTIPLDEFNDATADLVRASADAGNIYTVRR